MTDFFCVIPAREDSKRFPKKLLFKMFGKEIIIHTVYACARSRAQKVFVATDSEIINELITNFKNTLKSEVGEKIETKIVRGKKIKSGSDRVGELIRILRIGGAKIPDIIVNVQGDEPLITPSIINSVADFLAENNEADISTYGFWSDDKREYENPNRVKIVIGKDNFALYFSRSPIPFGAKKYVIHSGIYAFRLNSLEKFLSLKQTHNEKTEKLEQLRALDNGMKIRVLVGKKKLIPVDTPEDVKNINRIIRRI
ncbi:MAG: 3-deoxy-manno-octulosonate cytidylyltransferase [Candidatus Calescibacterium sp.]|nr:3-deoxy-manno-octulosonate cytidylyltransferase [Candidatus Calescibacterium sp.]MCX7733210.1 3-deoxy-manno-octulosonate cytidylyltransferase [bacterium]MDW8086917.1 3-deoxy-manno-octulosonate cytidylyltransferase [Candidatus Calescibacterium sp.]